LGWAGCSESGKRDAADLVVEPLTIGVQLQGRGKILHQALRSAIRRQELENSQVRVLSVPEGAAMLKEVSLELPLQTGSDPGDKWNPRVRQQQVRLMQFLVRKELDCALLSLDLFLRMLISAPEGQDRQFAIVAQLGATTAGRRTRHLLVRSGGKGIGDPPLKGRTIAFLDHPLEHFQLEQLLEDVGASSEDIEMLAVKDPILFLPRIMAAEPDLVLSGFGAVAELRKLGFWPLVQPVLKSGMEEVDVLICHRSDVQSSPRDTLLRQVVARVDDLVSGRFELRRGALPGGLGVSALPDVPFLSELSQQLIDAGLTTEERAFSVHLVAAPAASSNLSSTEAGAASSTKLTPDSRIDQDVPE
jgi:hypothetical protein